MTRRDVAAHEAKPRTGYDAAWRVVYYRWCRTCDRPIKRRWLRGGWRHA